MTNFHLTQKKIIHAEMMNSYNFCFLSHTIVFKNILLQSFFYYLFYKFVSYWHTIIIT